MLSYELWTSFHRGTITPNVTHFISTCANIQLRTFIYCLIVIVTHEITFCREKNDSIIISVIISVNSS